MNISLTRIFYVACITLLTLPFLIFTLGWLPVAVSIPVVLLCCGSLGWWLRKAEFPEIPFVENRRTLVFAALLTACWVFASGIGGYAYQNYDHYYRNAVLFDLTLRDWPVVFPEDGTTLVYYFGFFLLPALGGKAVLMAGAAPETAVNAAYFVSFVQAFLAVFATYVLLSQRLGRFSLWPLVFFIGFSGLDFIPYLMFHRSVVETPEMATVWGKIAACFGPRNAPHLEWFTHPWLNSSMTGLLFWVFNQSVPFLLALMLFLMLRDWRGVLLIYAALFLSAPFPALGLFPVMVWRLLKDAEFRIPAALRTVCTPANLLSIPVVLIIAHFYSGNLSSGHSQFVFPATAHEWTLFGVYFLTEFGVWLLCIGRKWNAELGICLAVVCVTSFFKLGGGADFAMRTAIPCFTFLMLAVLQTWYSAETPSWRRVLIVCVFLIGALTPLMEFKRCAGNTILTYVGVLRGSETVAFAAGPECVDGNEPRYYIRDERLHSVHDLLERDDPCAGNFLGTTGPKSRRR
ncbi:MAG: hypothetical protein IJQ31_01480 [Thermoguttaceae bacterium]|nr:hypothetical protein [Thermoguttaceae bacterium]